MGGFKQSISDDEITAKLSNFEAALKPFFKLRPTMPLQYVTSFLLVAAEEGLNVTEYARRARITPSLMTRHLADIGKTNRYHTPGFGLVEQFDHPRDKRQHLMRLSTKGKGMVGQILGALTR
jgi:DNA-binding MarR family transcriptional regulator